MKSHPNPRLLRALLPVLALVVTAPAAATGAMPPVKLEQPDQARLGVRIQPATAVRLPPQVTALGRALSPQPWLSLIARLQTAQATAAASAAEAQRLRRLYAAGRNTSLKALQAAQARARADALVRDQLRQVLRLDWGAALAGLKPAQQARLSTRLADGATVLVRADAPAATAGAAPTAATLRALDGGAAITAEVLERAPNVDPELQAPAWLLRVDGADARRLRPGQTLRVWLRLAGTERAAIQVPESAIVRIGGRPYAYVRVVPERFQAHALTLLAPRGDGWAAVTNIAPGAALVVDGADALWWAQQAPSPGRGGKKTGAMRGDGDDD
ncbi:MAG: hypothetical protein KGJ55_10955 [Gammaproteobacteria bacterium]|nr:hypothetical protein [Gammaproteobacteria bacterium]